MRLTIKFDLEEFASPDADFFPITVLNNIDMLASNLQTLRHHIGIPIHINSGWRTPEHNKKVGGLPNSQHLLGKAADLRTNLTPKELHAAIEELILEGRMMEGGLGLYDTFVHYDIRGTKARWDYRKKKDHE